MRGAIQVGGAGEKGDTYSTSAEPRLYPNMPAAYWKKTPGVVIEVSPIGHHFRPEDFAAWLAQGVAPEAS